MMPISSVIGDQKATTEQNVNSEENQKSNSAQQIVATAQAECFKNSLGNNVSLQKSIANNMVSFNSSSDEAPDSSKQNEAPGNKMNVVCSLLSMLSSHDRLQSSQMLLNFSQDRETCHLIRRSGFMSLIVQLLHPSDIIPLPPPTGDELEVIQRASEALKNIVAFDDNEIRRQRDSAVLNLLAHVRNYVLHLRLIMAGAAKYDEQFCNNACVAMSALTNLSFDNDPRRSICALGGLNCVAEALILDQAYFENKCAPVNQEFRRLIGMILTNLTFGALEIKRMLCSNNRLLLALNAQISSQPEELKRIFAGVLRNLSWKIDTESKIALKDAGAVKTLMLAAMEVDTELPLRYILWALWNLTGHCSENKAQICAIPSAVQYLVSTLARKDLMANTITLESCTGILKNISCYVSLKEEYRTILRQHCCFRILLEHLESPSLTVVSNVCGILWNLSAHNVQDQRTLIEMGAEKKLRDLVHSKHPHISDGASKTLKNLLSSRSRIKSTNSSSSSSTLLRKTGSSGLMKLRQSKMEKEEEDDDDDFSQESSSAAIASCQSMDNSLRTSPSSSSKQRHISAMEVAAMLNDVTRPINVKFGVPKFLVQPMSISHTTNEVTTNAELIRTPQRMHSSAISASVSSKEELMQTDKANVNRLLNGLRRNNQPSQMKNESTKFNFPPTDSATASFKEPLPVYCDQSGYFPIQSKENEFKCSGSSSGKFPTSKLNEYEQSTSSYQQRPSLIYRKPSTPAEFKSEPPSRGSKSGTALCTPLMYSRQSSMESLESCDIHSVRSTVYSEYSQLQTGLPSPSELPDSPTNIFPAAVIGEEKKQQERKYSHPSCNSSGRMDFDCFIDKTDRDEEKPRNWNAEGNGNVQKKLEIDDEEKPKIFRKTSEIGMNRLSASSSLSALTLDSDVKNNDFDEKYKNDPSSNFAARSSKQQPKQEPPLLEICQELEDCILAAKPSPKPAQFKSPAPRGHSSTSKKSIQWTPPSKNLSTDFGATSQQTQDESDLKSIMESAMPKPKAIKKPSNSGNIRLISAQHKGKNIAIAKPIVRVSPSRSPAPSTVPRNFSQSNNSSNIQSSSNQRVTNVMENSEEIQECIASAMPKPKPTRKSKSLDRKTPSRTLSIASTNDIEIEDEKSGIANSIEPTDYKSLLLSCSSAILSSATTAERVKDASLLFDMSNSVGNRTPPVARIAPEPHGKNLEKLSAIINEKSDSSNGTKSNGLEDSLSEDNYSQIGDDSFAIQPEDIDLDSLKEEDWVFVVGNNDNQLPSPTELLIDCETFVTSNNRPRIMKGPPPPPPKIVKGGRKSLPTNLASTFAAPKVTVRTTKATELRAKKTLEQANSTPKSSRDDLRATSSSATNSRSRSMSPASPGLQPRFMVGKTSPSPIRSPAMCSEKSPIIGRRQGACVQNSNLKAKRELGLNVKSKIASLQITQQPSSSDNEASISSADRRTKISNQSPSLKSPRQMTKNNQIEKSDNKGQDSKRALVTTV